MLVARLTPEYISFADKFIYRTFYGRLLKCSVGLRTHRLVNRHIVDKSFYRAYLKMFFVLWPLHSAGIWSVE